MFKIYQTLRNSSTSMKKNINNFERQSQASFLALPVHFWSKKQQLLNLYKHLYLWRSELLFRFGNNNVSVVLRSPTRPSPVYKNFFISRETYLRQQRQFPSQPILSFMVGRCGFVRNQKQTFLAYDVAVRTGLWFVKRFNKLLNPIQVHFIGASKYLSRHLKRLKDVTQGADKVIFHSLQDRSPTPFNGTKTKMTPRKRFRYHSYQYNKLVNRFS